jgi:RimJ/RimL family protein N-acetyltransferase
LLKTAVDESLEHLLPWMPWAHHEPQELQQKIQLVRTFRGQFDLGHDFTYGIFDRDERNVLGGTGLHLRRGDDAREIGYWIHQHHTKQGLATESTAALTKVAFEIDRVARIEIHCDVANSGSAAVPARLGYRHEATRRRLPMGINGAERDTMIWTMFGDEYPESVAAAIDIEAFDAIGRRIL